MRATYCRRWNFDRHTPIDPLTPEQAATSHQVGELYTVALGDPAVPDVVIEVVGQNKFLGVWFFEPGMRQSISYGFRQVDEENLFLEQVGRWKYTDTKAETLSGASVIETFNYHADGKAKRVVVDKAAYEKVVQERSGVDVADHGEPVPAFGDWTSVARYDRSKSATRQ